MFRLDKLLVASALLYCVAPPSRAQFTQQGPKLIGSGAAGFPQQGSSVALSADGNTALVGAPYDNGRLGAVWVFARSGGAWSQQGPKRVGSGAVGSAYQGFSVALSADGNTALVGAPFDNPGIGVAWVFTRSDGVWSQQGSKLVGTGASNSGGQGMSVALSADGNTALVGGGGVWIFTRSGETWSQQGSRLVGAAASNSGGQGTSAALSADGNTALVGGDGVWIFTRSGEVWSQQGNQLTVNDASGDANLGASVALSADGNTALIGGSRDNQVQTPPNAPPNSTGAAWVFTRSRGTWSQQGGKLVGAGASGFPNQGLSVALSADGNTALVGGPFDDNFGAAWVFTGSGGVWKQVGSKLVGSAAVAGDLQGYSVALSADGSTALLGGPAYSNSLLGGNVGGAWVFAALPSTTSLSASPNPSGLGQAVTFTAIVTAGATGTVTFTIDGVPQPPVALRGNQAQLTISGLALGSHTISAEYSGDSTFLNSTSSVLSQTVLRGSRRRFRPL